MKEYTYDLNAADVINLANLTQPMTGEGKMKLLRKKMVDRIVEVWPEYGPDAETDGQEKTDENHKTDENQKRKIIFNSKWIRAYGMGIVHMISDSETTGADVHNYMRAAKMLRISNWVEKKLNLSSVEDFDDKMDDEAELIEPESDTAPCASDKEPSVGI